MSELPYSAAWLASLPLEQQQIAIQELDPEQLLAFQHDWEGAI